MKGGPRRISPFFIPAAIANLASGWVSIRTGAKGPNSCTCTACTSSAHALGDSFRLIQRGDADAMIAGGSEAAITPLAVGRLRCHARALHPQRRSREGLAALRQGPRRLRDRRGGGDPGPRGAGAGARRRGARIYCEVVGYGMSGDAFHITAPCEDGDGAIRVMRATLKDAGVEPAAVDYVNATAPRPRWATRWRSWPSRRSSASTPDEAGDQLHEVDDRAPPGRGGRPGGGDHRPGPPRPGRCLRPSTSRTPTPPATSTACRTWRARPSVRYALSNSFGFGGTNGALLFKRFEASDADLPLGFDAA